MAARTNITLSVLIGAIFFLTNMKACYSSPSTATNTQFIMNSCSTTTYRNVCVTSLSSYSTKIKTSYPKLTYTALLLSLKSTKNASLLVSNLSRKSSLKQIEVAALKDCVENLGSSIEEITQSLKVLKNLIAIDLDCSQEDFDFRLSNVMTWVSAALTEGGSCMDGLYEESVNWRIRYIMRSKMLDVERKTSNALALINKLEFSQFTG